MGMATTLEAPRRAPDAGCWHLALAERPSELRADVVGATADQAGGLACHVETGPGLAHTRSALHVQDEFCMACAAPLASQARAPEGAADVDTPLAQHMSGALSAMEEANALVAPRPAAGGPARTVDRRHADGWSWTPD